MSDHDPQAFKEFDEPKPDTLRAEYERECRQTHLELKIVRGVVLGALMLNAFVVRDDIPELRSYIGQVIEQGTENWRDSLRPPSRV